MGLCPLLCGRLCFLRWWSRGDKSKWVIFVSEVCTWCVVLFPLGLPHEQELVWFGGYLSLKHIRTIWGKRPTGFTPLTSHGEILDYSYLLKVLALLSLYSAFQFFSTIVSVFLTFHSKTHNLSTQPVEGEVVLVVKATAAAAQPTLRQCILKKTWISYLELVLTELWL